MKKYFYFIISLIIILNLITNITCFTIELPNENKESIQKIDRLQKIKEKGVLTVLSANDEPFSYRDPKTGQFSGFDAEIIQEVANHLGVKEVSVKYVSFTDLLEFFLRNPEIDLIADGLFITDNRKHLVDFTTPLYTDEDTIMVRKDSGINSKEDLKNVTIGVLGGTIFITMAEKWKQQGLLKNYIVFNDNDSLQKALENKMIKAILTNYIIGQNYLSKNPKSNSKLLSPNQYKSESEIYLGYPVRKEDTTLLNSINEKLQEIKDEGTLYEIINRYGLRYNYIP